MREEKKEKRQSTWTTAAKLSWREGRSRVEDGTGD